MIGFNKTTSYDRIKLPFMRLFVKQVIQVSNNDKNINIVLPALCEGNLSATDGFRSQRTGNEESVSIWWRHPDIACNNEMRQGKEHNVTSYH